MVREARVAPVVVAWVPVEAPAPVAPQGAPGQVALEAVEPAAKWR